MSSNVMTNDRPMPFERPQGCRMLNLRCRCILRRWPAVQELSAAGLEKWVAGWRSNGYARGNVLFYQGNQPQGAFFVCTGAVKLVSSDGNGRHQIVRVVRGPELLGERALVAGEPYEATAEVQDEARVCFMDAERFHALWGSEPGVPRLFARRLAERLGEVQEALAEMGQRTIRERLARLIARAFEAAPSASTPASLGGSRQELAELLGTSAEVVCRALSELERKGLIAVEGRFARVLDVRRLRAAAGLPAPIDFYQPPSCAPSSRRTASGGDNSRAAKMKRTVSTEKGRKSRFGRNVA